jgi:hypothetical protein
LSTVRVNLLPPEVARRSAQRRAATVTAGVLVLYVLLLGLLYLVKLDQVNDARVERDAAQAEVTGLQARITALQPFRELRADVDARNELLAQAMAEEVSVARMLNELSLAFPSTSSLRAFAVALDAPVAAAGAGPVTPPPAPAPTPQPAPGTPAAEEALDQLIGTVTFEGYSVEAYAPGVEAVVVDIARVPSLVDPFVAAAQVEQIGDTDVTAFSGNADVDATAYTRRYEQGLPLEGPR